MLRISQIHLDFNSIDREREKERGVKTSCFSFLYILTKSDCTSTFVLTFSLLFLAMCHGPDKERAVNPDFEFVRDYSALNKAALEAGNVTAKDQSRFR